MEEKSSNSSNKRKETTASTTDPSKKLKNNSREVFQSIGRTIAALAETDGQRFEKGHDELQESCANEILAIVEKYKKKTNRN